MAVARQVAWLEQAVSAAVVSAGAQVVAPGEAEALIWGFGPAEELESLLADAPAIAWVQLSAAGVEGYRRLFDDGRVWTSMKGAFAAPVAEHALALALAGLHDLPRRARARTWEEKGGRTLSHARVVVLGGGGVAEELLRLLEPFQAEVTVVRKRPRPMPGAALVLRDDELSAAISGVDLVILAAALTPETQGMIGKEELQRMGPRCWVVNVGRGPLLRTDELVRALQENWIAGAALDVTDPEPLPDDHPLWRLPNCLITPHTANPAEYERDELVRTVRTNIRARIEGRPLEGRVDVGLGY